MTLGNFFIAFCSAAALAVGFSGCSEKQTSPKQAGHYPLYKVENSTRTLTSDYATSMTGKQTVEVRPQVSGMLTEICIKEGDAVRRGQVLFRIDSAQFQAAYDIAEANVRSAEAAVSTARLVLDSNQELYDEKVISDFELSTSKNDLAEATAKLNLAKAELAKSATNLSYTTVISPVSGIASMIPYRVGSLVSSSMAQPLVTVSDDSEIYAYFSMSENQMLDLATRYGSMADALEDMPPVELRMSNGAMYDLPGHIDAVSGTINTATGAVTFRAVFDNPKRLLRDGGTGTVVIPAEYTDVIVIPQAATFELQDRVFVYKIEDGKATASEVQVLPQNNGREYVVTDGLRIGDVIIAEGAGLVKEGTVVTPDSTSQS